MINADRHFPLRVLRVGSPRPRRETLPRVGPCRGTPPCCSIAVSPSETSIPFGVPPRGPAAPRRSRRPPPPPGAGLRLRRREGAEDRRAVPRLLPDIHPGRPLEARGG